MSCKCACGVCVYVKVNLKCGERRCEKHENDIPGKWPRHRHFVSRGWSWCSVMLGPCKTPERGNKPSEIKKGTAVILLWGQPYLSIYIKMQTHVRPPRESHQVLGCFNSQSSEAPAVTWRDARQCLPLPTWGNHAIHNFWQSSLVSFILRKKKKRVHQTNKIQCFCFVFPCSWPSWIKHLWTNNLDCLPSSPFTSRVKSVASAPVI